MYPQLRHGVRAVLLHAIDKTADALMNLPLVPGAGLELVLSSAI